MKNVKTIAKIMFSIQPQKDLGRESLAIISQSRRLGLDCKFSVNPIVGTIPIGSVEYCEQLIDFGSYARINFYPDIFSKLISREIYWIGDHGKVYLFNKRATKSSEEYFRKKSNKRKVDTYPRKVEPYWEEDTYTSESVDFIQEWRYYIAEGCVFTAGWYSGNDEDEPPPKLDIDLPSDFSGAVDVGRLGNGKLELVEAHAPFGCGWYGDSSDNEQYVLWQYYGWKSFLKNNAFWYLNKSES